MGVRPGLDHYLLRLETENYQELKRLAERRQTTVRALLEGAVTDMLRQDAVERQEAAMAPVIQQVLADQLQPMRRGLHSLNAKVGHEVLRSQYLLIQFLLCLLAPSEEDRPAAEKVVWSWFEDGWSYAVKQLKKQTEPEL